MRLDAQPQILELRARQLRFHPRPEEIDAIAHRSQQPTCQRTMRP